MTEEQNVQKYWSYLCVWECLVPKIDTVGASDAVSGHRP